MSVIAGPRPGGPGWPGAVPTGQLLTPAVWAQRHRGIVWLLWLHVAGVAVFAWSAARPWATRSPR